MDQTKSGKRKKEIKEEEKVEERGWGKAEAPKGEEEDWVTIVEEDPWTEEWVGFQVPKEYVEQV